MFYNYIFLILHVIYVNEHKSKYRLIHVSCKKNKNKPNNGVFH